MEQPIYQENFVNSRVLKDAKSIAYVVNEIKKCHPSELGWTVSEPTITPNPDGITVTLSVQLKKYNVKQVGRSL